MDTPNRQKTSANAPNRPSLRAGLKTLLSLSGQDWFDSHVPDVEGAYYSKPTGAGIEPRCDLWRSTNSSGASVLLVHGGGFVMGHRRMKAMRLLATHFATQGAHVCSVDYRMLFRGGRLEEAVSDVRDALEWWSDDPMGWELDPQRIAVVALSAGAALALLATGQSSVPISRLAAVFGVYDFRTLTGHIPEWIASQLVGSKEPSRLLRKSPLGQEQTKAPVLLIHGDNDRLVPVAQAYALCAERERRGLPCQISVYAGAPHAFLNWDGPFASQALQELSTFLDPALTPTVRSEAV